jgi:transcriptional regulator with XRE-family HTH domain
MDKLTISERVKIELQRKCMTQAELAEKLHVEPMTISRRMSSGKWKQTEIYFMKQSLKFEL